MDDRDHLKPGKGKRAVGCFQCDGTGQMCEICGESKALCQERDSCSNTGDEYEDCDNCEGGGTCFVTRATT